MACSGGAAFWWCSRCRGGLLHHDALRWHHEDHDHDGALLTVIADLAADIRREEHGVTSLQRDLLPGRNRLGRRRGRTARLLLAHGGLERSGTGHQKWAVLSDRQLAALDDRQRIRRITFLVRDPRSWLEAEACHAEIARRRQRNPGGKGHRLKGDALRHVLLSRGRRLLGNNRW